MPSTHVVQPSLNTNLNSPTRTLPKFSHFHHHIQPYAALYMTCANHNSQNIISSINEYEIALISRLSLHPTIT
ncbi:Uncharacterized protein HZ326_11116 [Fusarium oxysporum f. sp. albedinis]|nr:Uncharacterized protein HZ326_11116 [Fusarium oxysporum f. sp. albedinis]